MNRDTFANIQPTKAVPGTVISNADMDGKGNVDVSVGEKLTVSTNETDMFANRGDFIAKSVGKALIQGAKDARISKG